MNTKKPSLVTFQLTVFFVALMILMSGIALVSAQTVPITPPPDTSLGGGTDTPINNLTEAASFTNRIVQWMTAFFWALSVGFLIWAAILYLLAQGDPTKVASAKQMLVYAIIAGGIGILAFGIRTIVGGLLAGT